MEYLTIKEVCEVLKISRWTAESMIKDGRLRASKIGKSYRIKRSDIDNFVEKNMVS
jgi:excisionase family DNA binding protein